MPRTETILQAFVASPSDVSEERSLLEEVVRELNLTWSKTFGIRVELLKWETHAYPDIGETSQGVINNQIGTDFDIFIGIMWGKFGTPTGNFGSGTEEEFSNAHRIYETGERKLWIMSYFKDAGISPSEVDLGQLKSINEFRSKLGKEGVLYWKFKTKDEFSKLLRLHLSRVIQEWRDKNQDTSKNLAPALSQTAIVAATEENAEDGLLDYFEKSLESGERVQQVALRLGETMTEIGSKINARSEELAKTINNKSSSQAVIFQAVRRITDHAARDVGEFANKIDSEIPNFKESFEVTIDSLTKIVTIQSQFNNKDTTLIESAIQASNYLLIAMTDVIPKISSLRDSIVSTPSISARYNASRQKAIRSVDRLTSQFTTGIRLLQEAQSVFNSLKVS